MGQQDHAPSNGMRGREGASPVDPPAAPNAAGSKALGVYCARISLVPWKGTPDGAHCRGTGPWWGQMGCDG